MPSDPTLAPVDLVEVGHCRVLRDVASQPGIETVEGRLVPLLAGDAIRSHVIVMHPGQYCWPHPHDTESLIFTISGRWVFCTTVDGTEESLEQMASDGEVFRLDELPETHPARTFVSS